MDKYIGKVILDNLPKVDYQKKDDGRYIVRTPKIGVLIRDQDFGKETLLPKNSKPREQFINKLFSYTDRKEK